MPEYLDDYSKLEDALIESLTLLTVAFREEVAQGMPALDPLRAREVVTSLLWRVARMLNGRSFAKTSDGREMSMTLGFVVLLIFP